MGIFGWFRKRGEERDKKQGTALWQSQYNINKAELTMRLLEFLAKPEFQGVDQTLVGYIMTAEPGNPDVWASASEEQHKAAVLAARAALEVPEMRNLAAEASYALALLFQGQAYNPRAPMEPDSDKLLESMACVTNAIEFGDRPAFYHATAAQTLGMMKDFDGAYEEAKLAVQADPSNPEAARMMGMTAAGVDRLDEAEQYLRRAKELAPSLSGVEDGLRSVSRLRQVLNDVEAEVSLNPNIDDQFRKFIRDAHDGDTNCMGILAGSYRDGTVVAPNPTKAYMWYYVLARLGDPVARELINIDPVLEPGANEGKRQAERWLKTRGL